MLTPPNSFCTKPVKIQFTTVLQSKHILRGILTLSATVCSIHVSKLNVNSEHFKEIVDLKHKIEDYMKLWVKTGLIPFKLKVPWWKSRCVRDFIRKNTLKHTYMAMELHL